MKNLNTYINEGLADWGEDKVLNKKMSKQTTKAAIKQEIIDWITNNTYSRIVKSRLKFDFNTDPITVNYDDNINFKENRDSLTNGIFQWGEIDGHFNCAFSNITTLEGSPEIVRGIFDCNNCKNLISLEGSPKKCGSFICRDCINLKSLKGCPQEVTTFDCNNTGIDTLKNDIKTPVHKFVCSNTNIKNLEGCPQNVKTLHAYGCNKLKSLKGIPKVLYDLQIYQCDHLEKIDYSPDECEYFDCSYCKSLVSIKKFDPKNLKTLKIDNCPINDLDETSPNIKKLLTKKRIIEWCSKNNIYYGPQYTIYDNIVTPHESLDFWGSDCEDLNAGGLFEWGEYKYGLSIDTCNELQSLKGAPEKIGGILKISSCIKMKSLEGCPDCREIQLYFIPIENLKGISKNIKNGIVIRACDELETLEGAPKKIQGDLIINGCKSLKSLGDIEVVEGHLSINDCPLINENTKLPEVKGRLEIHNGSFRMIQNY